MIKLFGHIIYNNGWFGGEYISNSITNSETKCGLVTHKEVTIQSEVTYTILRKAKNKLEDFWWNIKPSFEKGTRWSRIMKYYLLKPLLTRSEMTLIFAAWDELELYKNRDYSDIILSDKYIYRGDRYFHMKFTKTNDGRIIKDGYGSFGGRFSMGSYTIDENGNQKKCEPYKPTKEQIEEAKTIVKDAKLKYERDEDDYKAIRKAVISCRERENIDYLIITGGEDCQHEPKHDLQNNQRFRCEIFYKGSEHSWWQFSLWRNYNLPLNTKIPFDEILKINY